MNLKNFTEHQNTLGNLQSLCKINESTGSVIVYKILFYKKFYVYLHYHQLRTKRALKQSSVENQKGGIAIDFVQQQCPSASEWNIIEQH